MGATDPTKAAAGTIRKDFATDIEKNTVHGSDSPENARMEVSYFFPEVQIHAYEWKKLGAKQLDDCGGRGGTLPVRPASRTAAIRVTIISSPSQSRDGLRRFQERRERDRWKRYRHGSGCSGWCSCSARRSARARRRRSPRSVTRARDSSGDAGGRGSAPPALDRAPRARPLDAPHRQHPRQRRRRRAGRLARRRTWRPGPAGRTRPWWPSPPAVTTVVILFAGEIVPKTLGQAPPDPGGARHHPDGPGAVLRALAAVGAG